MLDRVKFYKYLGVMIDDHLNFNRHIQDNMNKIVSHKLFMFPKTRFYINETDAILLFKTLILPIIEDCDIIYEGTSAKNLNKIDRLSKQVLKICIRNRNPKITDNLELQKICKLCNQKIRRQVHSMLCIRTRQY